MSPTARFTAFLIVVLGCVAQVALLAQSPVAASGREFYVVLPSAEFAFSAHVMRVNIAAPTTATVTLFFTEYGTSETVQIPSGGRWERTIPVDSIMLREQEYRSNRSIRITSTAPVTVNVINDNDGFMSEGYLALPTTTLGYDYLALCYPDTSFSSGQPNTRGSVVAVVATEDDTEVRLTPSAMTFGGNDAGSTLGITLDRGELYQIIPTKRPGIDLTGTHITASKPVAVFSGHRAVATDSTSALNALVEQMTPVADWGRKFYSVKLPEQSRARYRVLAQRAGTSVRVNGLLVATLGAGAVAEFWTDPSVLIEASHPVLVAQIGTHRPSRSNPPEVDSDPSMAIVNPVDSYAERFEWATPTMARRVVAANTVGWNHWAIVTAPTSALGSVRLDGAPVNFTVPHADGAYSTAYVAIAPGVHRVTASQPVNVQLVGDSHFDTYAMPAGMRLREPLRADPVRARTCAAFIDTTITLTNFGAEPLQITGASFAAGSSSVYNTPTPPFTIFGGTSRDVRVRIALPRYGANVDTLIIATSTSGTRPLRIPIDVVRDSIAVDAVERSIILPQVSDAAPTRDTTITVVNTGTGIARIASVSLTGPFVLTAPTLPLDVAPGDTVRLRIRFAPVTAGVHNGAATIVLAPCGAPVTIALSGLRVRSAAIDVAPIAVPDVGCGSAGFSDTTIVIRNTGGAPLRFDSIEVRGPGAAVFTVVAPSAGTMIAPGDSIEARLRFTPPSVGAFTITLRIWNAASPGGYLLTSPITASRVAVVPVASTSAIDFGSRGACDSDTSLTFTLRNVGSSTMLIAGLNAATGAFTATAGVPAIPPGESATITVRFAPSGPGTFNDTLAVTTSPCDTTVRIALTGRRELASLTGTDTLDFGSSAACDAYVDRVVTVANNGSVALDLRTLSIADPAFAIVSVADSALAPGASASIVVRFATAIGSHSSQLSIIAQPCDVEHVVELRAVAEPVVITLSGALDFGTPTPDVPTQRTAVLTNASAVAVTVDRIALPTAVAGLRIVSPSAPLTLAPGESVPVVLEYLSSAPTAFESMLIAESAEPCDTTLALEVRGGSTAARMLSFELPDTSAMVDARITIPMRIRRAAEGNERVIASARVHWDHTMLAIERVTTRVAAASVAVRSDVITGAERVIDIEYTGDIPGDGAVVDLEMRVLIGSSDRTELRFTNAAAQSQASGAAWDVATRDGSFTTLGICDIGGGRFVRLAGTVVIKAALPNPTAERVTLAIESDVATTVRLALTDALGRSVGGERRADVRSGADMVDLDLSDLAPGLYQLSVVSGRHVQRITIIVQR